MSEPIRVIVQMRSTPSLAAASFGTLATAPVSNLSAIPGVFFDTNYSPVPVPPATPGDGVAFFSLSRTPVAPTFVVRAAVQQERLDDFLTQAAADPSVVGVFADARIQPIAPVCPNGPVGTDQDVSELLGIADLHAQGMDGTGVRVVIVDNGLNLSYLQAQGKQPAFDSSLSWGYVNNLPLGQMSVDHGTMCAYDVCIAAPACTLIDHALLRPLSGPGPIMDGLLSDAVQSYGLLLSYLIQSPSPFAGDSTPRTLVVNNSWGMFHPSWDFPVGSPQNYSDNPNHPFNIIVASLEAAGADLLFAAGNCGTECSDNRCQGVTDAGIYGASSHPAVLSVAGVKIDKQRIGYSTKGPGRLDQQKPDIAAFTHFAGSGVYPADGGTSAATPVAAGVVAAIRRLYPASVVAPGRLRDLIRQTADPQGGNGFNFEYGHGIINVPKLLTALVDEFGSVTGVAVSAGKAGSITHKSRLAGMVDNVPIFNVDKAEDSPLKSGPTAAPKFLVPRFKTDPGVTPEALRKRGSSFDLFQAIGQLDTPSLVSTAHGPFGRLLFTIPGRLLLDPAAQIMLDTITNLWSKLPTSTRLVVLTHEATVQSLNEKLAGLGLTARTEIVPAPNSVNFTVWAEDAYSIANDTTDNEVYFIEPASFRRYDDAYIADLIAPVTDLKRTQARLYFQGGNILIGDDFWLIGMDYPNNSLDLGYIVPEPNETSLEAIRRAYGQAMDRNRRLIPIGSLLPVPGFEDGELVREFQLGGQTWKEHLYRGNGSGTVQPMFHIDMFITLVGRLDSGQYQVMVGDPRMAAQTLGQQVKPEAMAEIYDDIANQLGALGFDVVRNPLPLTYDDNETNRDRSWYFATSNNALVLNDGFTKKVWLPTYGHRKWLELTATDAQNKSIWEGLGFEVIMLGDFHPFAFGLGAVHCIKKYLKRS